MSGFGRAAPRPVLATPSEIFDDQMREGADGTGSGVIEEGVVVDWYEVNGHDEVVRSGLAAHGDNDGAAAKHYRTSLPTRSSRR